MDMQGRKNKISGLDIEMSEEPWTFVAKGHLCALVHTLVIPWQPHSCPVASWAVLVQQPDVGKHPASAWTAP